MSKKSLTYLFIILSNMFWNSNAYAGMDLIETVLMSATGVLQKASGVVENVSTHIADVSSGKIFDEYYQDYIQVKGKLEQAKQRFEDMNERVNRLAHMNEGGNEVNSREMDKYQTEVANTQAQVEHSRQLLLARGRIDKDSLQDNDDNETKEDTKMENKDIKPVVDKDTNLSVDTKNNKSKGKLTPSGFENADMSSVNSRRFISSGDASKEKIDVKK